MSKSLYPEAQTRSQTNFTINPALIHLEDKQWTGLVLEQNTNIPSFGLFQLINSWKLFQRNNQPWKASYPVNHPKSQQIWPENLLTNQPQLSYFTLAYTLVVISWRKNRGWLGNDSGRVDLGPGFYGISTASFKPSLRWGLWEIWDKAAGWRTERMMQCREDCDEPRAHACVVCVCIKLCGGWLWSLRKGCWLGPMQTSLLGRGVDCIAERQHCPSVGPLFNLLQSKHWPQRLNGWEGASEGAQRGYMRGKRKSRRKIPQRDACFTYLVNFITYPPALIFPTWVGWVCGLVKEWGCADGHQVKRRAACFNAHGSVLDPLAWSDLRRYVCRGLCFCSICWNQIQQTASKI